jgi:hypothetical protein
MAASLFVLSACSLAQLFGQPTEANPWAMPSWGAGFEPMHETVPGDAKDGATLTVTPVDTTLNPTPIEGYVTFVRLENADGEVVMDQRTGESLMHVVPAGDYWLSAYLRTCDANCAYLDPAQDVCSLDVSLMAGESYRVEVSMQGQHCTLQ